MKAINYLVAMVVALWNKLFGTPKHEHCRHVPIFLVDDGEEPVEVAGKASEELWAMVKKRDECGNPKKAEYLTRGGQHLVAKVVSWRNGQLTIRRGHGAIFHRHLVGMA